MATFDRIRHVLGFFRFDGRPQWRRPVNILMMIVFPAAWFSLAMGPRSAGSAETPGNAATPSAVLAKEKSAKGTDVSSSRAGIVGKWRGMSMSENGRWLPEGSAGDLLLVFAEKTLTLRVASKLVAETPYTIDDHATPPAIDITFDGQLTTGVYECQGNDLRICLNNRGKGRPKAIAALFGSGCDTEIQLHRADEGPAPKNTLPADRQTPSDLKPVIVDEASAELKNVPSRQWTAVFSPDGKSLAVTAGWNDPPQPGELLIWDIRTTKLRLLRRQDPTIRTVAFSRNGKYMAIGDFAGNVKLLEPASGKLLATYTKRNSGVNSLAFTPDSKGLLSSSFDGTIKLWDIATNKEVCQFTVPKESINSIAVAPDGTRLAASTREGSVHVWDLAERKKRYSVKVCEDIVEMIVFAPDSKSFATGAWDNSVAIWDAESGKKLRDCSGHQRVVENVAFSPDGSKLATSDGGGNIILWSPVTAEQLATWQAHARSAFGLSFSPDGSRLATTSADHDPKLWDLKSGTLIANLQR